jgi:glutamate racemase
MRGATSVKVVGVVEAGVLAVQNAMPDRAKRILILGTPATVSSKAYEVALGKLGYNNLKSIATALFVPLVEEGIYDGVIVEAVFEHYFGNLERPDAIILGCTHFPLLAGAMRDYFGDEVLLIHSGDAIVEQLKKECDLVGQQEGSTIEYFASENPQKLQAVAKEWLKA